MKVLKDFDLATIARYIDWGPFFIAWEMPGRFPEVLSDKIFGVEATRLYNDATKMVEQLVKRNGSWQMVLLDSGPPPVIMQIR